MCRRGFITGGTAMRKLDFSQFGDKKAQAFTLLWIAFRSSYGKQAVGYEQMKLCNRLGAKLEAISAETPTPQDGTDRTLAKDTLLVEGVEQAKLLAMVKAEDIGWTYSAGKLVEVLIEALEKAPTVEVEERKPDGV